MKEPTGSDPNPLSHHRAYLPDHIDQLCRPRDVLDRRERSARRSSAFLRSRPASSCPPSPGPMSSPRFRAARCSTGSAPSGSMSQQSPSGRCSPRLQGLVGLVAGFRWSRCCSRCASWSASPRRRPFPGNARLVAAWFPAAERGTASAIFNSAQYFSLVAFAPLMGWLVHSYRLAIGLLGDGRARARRGARVHPLHPQPGAPSRDQRRPSSSLSRKAAGWSGWRKRSTGQGAAFTWANLGQLLASRMLLGIYLGQYCINVLTYFFVTWFPIYLVKERGLNILEAGFAAAAPALFGFVGGRRRRLCFRTASRTHRLARSGAQDAAASSACCWPP